MRCSHMEEADAGRIMKSLHSDSTELKFERQQFLMNGSIVQMRLGRRLKQARDSKFAK